MDYPQLVAISLAIGLIALLYSCVGHAGASGYIAVMTLGGFTTGLIKPTALVLNILVAVISTVQFGRAGHFCWSLFWPFALLSVPMAFLGGYLHLPVEIFKPLLGVVLLLSALRLGFRRSDLPQVSPPTPTTALVAGAGIGMVAGLTGTGGGIFLTPLLLLRGWAQTRSAAAVSALFILINSIAGLSGHVVSGQPIPSVAWSLAGAAIIGGSLGSQLGSRRLAVGAISLLLSVVLTIAGCKLILSS
ncbi:MAG: sulfite exporter TauE/SafE family protein [Cyanobacteria bacterium REEB459]|nr:sulfite exporter TauE/SafE family protein [Cyanobacteria bacterium REEB459]